MFPSRLVGTALARTSNLLLRVSVEHARRALSSGHKDIAYGSEARDSIARGVEKLTRAVSVTLGPKGRNVLIEQPYSAPKITKDGVTVAKSVVLEHRFENIGARLVQDVANKTNEAAGDGTTTATVLAHAIYTEGLKAVGYGCNPNDLRRGVQLAVDEVVKYLKKNARPVDSEEQIRQIATISANGDTNIGKCIADAMRAVKKEGVINIKEGTTLTDTIDVVQGMRFDRGYISPFFVTDSKQQRCEYRDPLLLICENKISHSNDILPAVEQAIAQRKPLLIIAEDVDGDALALLIVNKLRSALNVVAVRAPGFGDNRREVLRDIACLTGARLFSSESGARLEKATAEELGSCESITVCKEHTTLLGGRAPREDVLRRCDLIRGEIASSTSSYDRERLQERLAKLSEGVAVISVGGSSEVEVSERKDRFVDSLHATRAAVEEGILPGGGISLLRASLALKGLSESGLTSNNATSDFKSSTKTHGLKSETDSETNKKTKTIDSSPLSSSSSSSSTSSTAATDVASGQLVLNSDMRHGVDIVRRALMAPTSTIVRNAGGNGDFVIRMLTDPAMSNGAWTGFSMGYDAATENYTNMYESGIIDPLKVVRTALVDASGVASLLTTSECVIVEAQTKRDDSGRGGNPGHMMGGGDMGF